MSYTYVNVDSCLYVSIALLVSAIVAVISRIALRARGLQNARIVWSNHLDDLFCLLALVPTIGISTVMLYGAGKGVVGSHNEPSDIDDWINSTTPTLIVLEKLVYIMFVMQPLALGFTKLAFLFFYRRIFVWSGFQRVSLVFVIITVGFIIAFLFGFVFDCRLNFSANWGSLASIGEKCPFGFQPTIIFTVIDAALDFCILLLPMPCIWQLQMPTIRKVQVCGVFLLGGFAVAAALVRMVICIKQNTPENALHQTTVMGMPTYDIIGITSHGLFWTMIETNVALVACCLPCLRPILSIAAFGTFISSFGSFLQDVGSALGSSKLQRQELSSSQSTRELGEDQNPWSRVRAIVLSKGSDLKTHRSASDASLVEMRSLNTAVVPRERTATREKSKTPDPYDIYETDLGVDANERRRWTLGLDGDERMGLEV